MKKRTRILIVLALISPLAPKGYAACSADINFGTTDRHATAGSSNPTITGLPMPTEDAQAVNLYYLKYRLTANSSNYTIIDNISTNPLAASYAGTEVVASTSYAGTATTGNEFRFIDLTTNSGSVSFLSDLNAGHPLSTKGSTPVVFARPSAFTEQQLDAANHDDLGVTRYFLHTELSATNNATSTTNARGTQLLITNNNATSAATQSFGTAGGAFYRYRDGSSQFANEWSQWIRLDNREIDAQFARVDYLKFDGATLSVDARTPFALNRPVDSNVASIKTSEEARTADRDISLYLTAKGAALVALGNFTNSQPTGGGSRFTYNMSIDGSKQTLTTYDTNAPLVLDSKTDNIFFSDDDLRNVGTVSATNVNVATAANIADFIFDNNRLRTPGSLLVSSGGTNLAFDNNRLSGIERLEIADTLVFATAQVTAEGALLLNAANNQIRFDGETTVHASTSIDTFVLENSGITAGAASRNFGVNAANRAISFTSDRVRGLRDYSAETLVAKVASGTQLLMQDNTITTTAATLFINANTGVVDFTNNNLTAIHSLQVGNLQLTDDTISTTNGPLAFASQTGRIDMNNEGVTDIGQVTVDNNTTLNYTAASGGRITTTQNAFVFNSTSDVITVNNNTLTDIADMLIGNRLTVDNDQLSATGDITFVAQNNTISFSNNALTNIDRLNVGSLSVSENTISTSGNLTISASRDIQIGDSGSSVTIDANNNRLTNITDPATDQDVATKNYVDTFSINQLRVGANINMQGNTITRLSTPTGQNDLLTRRAIDSLAADITYFGDYKNTNYDLKGGSITGLPNPTQQEDLARLQDITKYAMPTSLMYLVRMVQYSKTNAMSVNVYGANVRDKFTIRGDRVTSPRSLVPLSSVPTNDSWLYDDRSASDGTTIVVRQQGHYAFIPIITCQARSASSHSITVRSGTAMRIIPRGDKARLAANRRNTFYGEAAGVGGDFGIGGGMRRNNLVKYSIIAPEVFWLDAGDEIIFYTAIKDRYCDFMIEQISSVWRS